jgi:hypothetical protein
MYCFEQKIAKSRWNSTTKGKNRACLEIWWELMPVSSFPLRPSVKMFFKISVRPAIAPHLVCQVALILASC